MNMLNRHTLCHKPPYNLITHLSSCKTLFSLLQTHAHLIISGSLITLDNNTTSTHLINSYSLFQKPDFARFVFDSTPNPRVIVWNSIIRAYTRSGKHNEALEMYRSLLENSLEPDKYTYTFVLKACAGISDPEEGFWVHRDIVEKGLESDVFVGTGLVDMYCKTGDLDSAMDVFDRMPKKDVVAWNAMISGLSHGSDPFKALSFFSNMQLKSGLISNSVSLLNLFPAVSKTGDIKLCKALHGYTVRRVYPLAVLNGLIDIYCNCGNARTGRLVFDHMWSQDDVSWATVMAGYSHNGYFSEVIELFNLMRGGNLKINNVAIVNALLAAAELRDLETGKKIHDCAIELRIDRDILIATPVMTMYAKCGEMEKAKNLFMALEGRDVVAWSAAIAVFSQSGYPEEALSFFREMIKVDLKPNRVTLVSVIPACGELISLRQGKSLHCWAIKHHTHTEVSVNTALVSMYVKCQQFNLAMNIFNRMVHRDVVTWNALISGYAQSGNLLPAVEIFCQLRLCRIHADSRTLIGILPAYALIGDLNQGNCVYGLIVKCGFEADCHVNNALVDMYVKCGSLPSAEFLFGKNCSKDEVSWNIIIAGYADNGHAKEAISAFNQMKLEYLQPNLVTVMSILPAISQLSDLHKGTSIHAFAVSMGFESNTLVGNSLIDMYAKCGHIEISEKIFMEMGNKDLISWNSLLAGYAVQGQGDRAIGFFSLMRQNHVEVDSVSFISVLSACRHVGLVDEGRKVFNSMFEEHGLDPELEHYACMVDMFGRAGLFEEALGLIKKMPMEPSAGVWGALLDACRMHSNVKFGELALDHLVKLEPENPAHYVVLASLFSQSNRWVEANNMRLKIDEMGLKKNPGRSWLGINKNNVRAPCLQA